MLAIDEQRATCNLPCVKNFYFPHAGDVSTKHLRSSSVSNVIKPVTAFFYCSLIGARLRAVSLLLRNRRTRTVSGEAAMRELRSRDRQTAKRETAMVSY